MRRLAALALAAMLAVIPTAEGAEPAVAAKGPALRLDSLSGRDVALTATVPSPCDAHYQILWGDGMSGRLFPPPLAVGVDCAALGPFSQHHEHRYAQPGAYRIELRHEGDPTAAAALSVTVR